MTAIIEERIYTEYKVRCGECDVWIDWLFGEPDRWSPRNKLQLEQRLEDLISTTGTREYADSLKARHDAKFHAQRAAPATYEEGAE